MIREITGVGEGKGPYVAISDGIGALASWANLLPNADRLALDTHLYFAFGGNPNTDPVNVPAPDGQMGGIWPGMACTAWKSMMNTMYATVNPSFCCQEVDKLFPAKSSSVSRSLESTAMAITIAAST